MEGKPSREEEELMAQLQSLSPEQQQQFAVLQIQNVLKAQKDLVKLSSTCYDRCSPGAPGAKLGSSEQKCMWRCAQRWQEAGFFINKYMMQKAEEQTGA